MAGQENDANDLINIYRSRLAPFPVFSLKFVFNTLAVAYIA
jgi:hypothetical protein